jgi:hypothetical protein
LTILIRLIRLIHRESRIWTGLTWYGGQFVATTPDALKNDTHFKNDQNLSELNITKNHCKMKRENQRINSLVKTRDTLCTVCFRDLAKLNLLMVVRF